MQNYCCFDLLLIFCAEFKYKQLKDLAYENE